MTAVPPRTDSTGVARAAGTGLTELSPQGKLVAVNDHYCDLLGRSREQLIGHSPVEFTHPADVGASLAAISDAQMRPDLGSQLEKRYLRADGQTVWVRVTEVWRPDLQRILGHVVEITETVRLRQAAHASTRRSQTLIEHCADLIFTVSRDGRLVEANRAARTLLSWPPGAAVADVIGDVVVPEDVDLVLARLASAHQTPGLSAPVTFRMRRQDGSLLHLTAVTDNQFADPDIQALIVNAHDVTAEREKVEQLDRHQNSLIAALARTAEFRDPYTAGHQAAVAELATLIAVELGLAADEVAAIGLGASIHDIGKIVVPAEILSRPGRLTAAEYEIVKTHCQVGRDILGDSQLAAAVGDVVLHHHERLDGSGYPDGLAGEQLSLAARIAAVADVLNAMSSHRPYRPGLGINAARSEIHAGSGTSYDPDVVSAALKVTAATRTTSRNVPTPRHAMI